MNEGWLELESDPGLFTLLVEEFGVNGVQVEEIYDLHKPIEGPVYGFIFLFKWIEERRARRNKSQSNGDEAYILHDGIDSDMFFAHQIVPNSCATHALLSVLLNCPNINLGDLLTDLKNYTKNFSAENKGYAIGNVPELAKIHNSHAHPEPRQIPEKPTGITTSRAKETFHFVSYVPVNKRLIELDGLKPHPIDHGLWGENEDWTEKFRQVIGERLDNEGGSSDIRFNLMAVVGDRCQAYQQKLGTLQNNKIIILDALDQLIRATHPHLFIGNKPTRNPPSSADDHTCSIPHQSPIHHSTTNANTMSSTTSLMQKSLTDDGVVVRVSPRELQDPEWDPVHKGYLARTETKRKHKKKKHKKHKKHAKRFKTLESVQTYRLPPALDSHNYAKSPLMSDEEVSILSSDSSASGSESNIFTDDESDSSKNTKLSEENKREGILKKHSAATSLRVTFKEEGFDDYPTDASKQLNIQTLFDSKESPSPSSSNGSTDTASEMGSAFNSPVCSTTGSRSCSPTTVKLLKFHQWKTSTVSDVRAKLEESLPEPSFVKDSKGKFMTTREMLASLENVARKHHASSSLTEASLRSKTASSQAGASSLLSQHGKPPFEQNDLLELLKSVEAEIDSYEQKLLDENEKRNKYKVDDCRRSHNYDPFICTFLAMLAEQSKLASLVEKHTLIKRRQGVSLGRLTKKPNRKRDRRQRKPRPGASVPVKKRRIR